MKKVIIELPDTHDDVISITAVGCIGTVETNVQTAAFDLRKGTRIVYENGKFEQYKEYGSEV